MEQGGQWSKQTLIAEGYALQGVIAANKQMEYSREDEHVCQSSKLSGYNHYVLLPTVRQSERGRIYHFKQFGYADMPAIKRKTTSDDDNIWVFYHSVFDVVVATWNQRKALLEIEPPCNCHEAKILSSLNYYCPDLSCLNYILKQEVGLKSSYCPN